MILKRIRFSVTQVDDAWDSASRHKSETLDDIMAYCHHNNVTIDESIFPAAERLAERNQALDEDGVTWFWMEDK